MLNSPSETQRSAGLHVRRIGTFFVIFHGGKPVSVSFREEAAAKCTLDYWQEQMAAGIIRVVDGALTPPPIEWKLPSPQRLVEAVAATAEADRLATRARLAALEAFQRERDVSAIASLGGEARSRRPYAKRAIEIMVETLNINPTLSDRSHVLKKRKSDSGLKGLPKERALETFVAECRGREIPERKE
ncbi:MAG TPA: hypothetical protein VFE60_03345 [Roseiarcus sp.]|jgi:hypothetical protein|nr:hypothetical protein [Roseiarcus sp.]